jgi:hypothetical protein
MLPKVPSIQPTMLVDCFGHPILVLAPDCDGEVRIGVNNIETVVRTGDNVSVVLAPALPVAGATAVMTLFVDSLNTDHIIVDVFADQPGWLQAIEFYTVASVGRSTGVILATTTSVLGQIIYQPSRDRTKFKWTNTGVAAVTTLEMTVTRVGSCDPLTAVDPPPPPPPVNGG